MTNKEDRFILEKFQQELESIYNKYPFDSSQPLKNESAKQREIKRLAQWFAKECKRINNK